MPVCMGGVCVYMGVCVHGGVCAWGVCVHGRAYVCMCMGALVHMYMGAYVCPCA